MGQLLIVQTDHLRIIDFFLIGYANDVSTIKLAREFFYWKRVGSIYALSIQCLVFMVVASAGKIEVTHAAGK